MLQKNVIPTVIRFVKLTRIIFIANLRGYVKKKIILYSQMD